MNIVAADAGCTAAAKTMYKTGRTWWAEEEWMWREGEAWYEVTGKAEYMAEPRRV